MIRSTTRFAALGVLCLTAGCMIPRAQYDRLVTEYHSENQARIKLESELARREAELAQAQADLSAAESRADSVGRDSQARIAQLEKALNDAKASMASPYGDIEGLSIIGTNEGFTILMQDKLLFDPGSTAIRKDGQDALARIAKEIVSSNYQEVRIDGHTDSDPVKVHKETFPLGNHQLAAERALSVYDYLANQGHVPASVLSLAAFGPNRPLVPGDSPEAKAKNRRVEIHVRVPATN